ncbi:MAG TPA: glycosyl hydrolase family 28 protein [Polyangiaceae bacterium]
MRWPYLAALALALAWGCATNQPGEGASSPPGSTGSADDAGIAADGAVVVVADGGIADAARGTDGSAAADGSVDAALRVCDVKHYGAKGDGVTKDTAAIQAAIDDCATSGGEVLLQNGTFLSGMIVLRSHITLDVDTSATLLGSQDIADYPDRNPSLSNTQLANCKKALVYAESANDVHIEGHGTIDGNAAGVAMWNGDTIHEGMRPMVVFTVLSSNVTIQDVTVKNGAVWAVVNMQVQHLLIDGITVDSNLGPTHDGIDVVDGNDVIVQNCTVASGDDSICLKSGSSGGLQNVTVQNCHTTQSGVANGVKLGTASVGPFRNIDVENVTIENAQSAGLAVESVDGSKISSVAFRHVTTTNVGTPIFVLLGSRNRDPSQVGSIDGVTFDDVQSASMRYNWGSIVTGSIVGGQTFGISNLTFSNLKLAYDGAGASPNPAPFTVDSFPEYQGQVPGQPAGTLYNQYPDAKFFTGTGGNENTTYHGPGYAFFVRHASGVTFTSCTTPLTGTDSRPSLATKDVTGLTGSCAP